MEFLRRIRSQGFTPREFRTICVAALVMLCLIVVSGAAVRLTGSGLGCVDWPHCNDNRVVDVSSKHAAIEQINRLFTFLVALAVALAAVAAWYRRPRRRDLLVLAGVMLIGVPAQGLVGAVVVWTKLHPATVQLHFVLSMVLVWSAVLLLVRSGEPDSANPERDRRRIAVVPRVRGRVRLVAIWTALSVIAGTVVTGTGPHAGDAKGDDGTDCSVGAAKRFFGEECDVNGNALVWATRAHGVIVWITVLVTFSLLWQLRRLRHDREVLAAPITAWIVVALTQGAIGYVQYANALPAFIVGLHIAGATALVACTAWMWSATTRVATPATPSATPSDR